MLFSCRKETKKYQKQENKLPGTLSFQQLSFDGYQMYSKNSSKPKGFCRVLASDQGFLSCGC
uniref:Uncharacterized protein n=1 Tax=Medicago truncatula TaxID=3880 RepID=B7FFL6_MEDTR|nr:unknown [Medicago truncatula]